MELNEAAAAGHVPEARLRVVGISVVAAIGGFLFGFDTAVIHDAHRASRWWTGWVAGRSC